MAALLDGPDRPSDTMTALIRPSFRTLTAAAATSLAALGTLATALRRHPGDPNAITGVGNLALARHEFRLGLTLGTEAHRRAPEMLAPYFVIVDADVELGRYAAADSALQQLVDLRPTLASYA